ATIAVSLGAVGTYRVRARVTDLAGNEGTSTLRETKQRLLILSPWIRAKVVNRPFVRQLENLLKQNVKVYIGYGLGEEDTQMNDVDRRAEQDLKNLASRFAHFAFVRLGDTHAKVLISERRFLVSPRL